MSESAIIEKPINTMTASEVEKVRELETAILKVQQTPIATTHILHAGMYSRTIKVPAGVILTGALMKIATQLIISGDFVIFIGGKAKELHGYNIFSGGPNRKQAGLAITDTHVTMIFPTTAKTVAEAEAEFTDETELLFSRYPDAVNHVHVTEE